MKRLIFILTITILSTALGLYLRPSYFLIGQMDWMNVLTKGYFVGSFSRFFSQGFLDESFYFVLQFTGGGLIGGILLSMMMSGKKGKKSSAKKRA
jgi:hypothetical protein